jgi:ATPase subunit of ABC transporter with duplicated ATPase domains
MAEDKLYRRTKEDENIALCEWSPSQCIWLPMFRLEEYIPPPPPESLEKLEEELKKGIKYSGSWDFWTKQLRPLVLLMMQEVDEKHKKEIDKQFDAYNKEMRHLIDMRQKNPYWPTHDEQIQSLQSQLEAAQERIKELEGMTAKQTITITRKSPKGG